MRGGAVCRGLPPSGWRAQTAVARAREVLLVDSSSAASRISGGECRQAQARTRRPCQRKAGSVGGKADVAPALARSSGDHGRCQCQDGGCRRRCAVTTRRAQGWQARTPVTAHVKRGVPCPPPLRARRKRWPSYVQACCEGWGTAGHGVPLLHGEWQPRKYRPMLAHPPIQSLRWMPHMRQELQRGCNTPSVG